MNKYLSLTILLYWISLSCNGQGLTLYDGINTFFVQDGNDTVPILCCSTIWQDDAAGMTGYYFADEGIYAGNYILPKQVAVKGKMRPVKKVNGEAFSYCPDLESITMTDSVELIGMLNVIGCKNLKQITMKAKSNTSCFPENLNYHNYDIVGVNKNHMIYKRSHSGITAKTGEIPVGGILIKSIRYLIYNDMAYVSGIDTINPPLKVVVQKTVKHNGKNYPVKAIMMYAFQGSPISEVVLPDGLKYIGAYAFNNCKKLQTINIPNSVEFLGEDVLSGCISLQKIAFPSSLLYLPYGCVSDCTSLEETDIPISVKWADENWNSNCPKLKNIHKHGNLKTIE